MTKFQSMRTPRHFLFQGVNAQKNIYEQTPKFSIQVNNCTNKRKCSEIIYPNDDPYDFSAAFSQYQAKRSHRSIKESRSPQLSKSRSPHSEVSDNPRSPTKLQQYKDYSKLAKKSEKSCPQLSVKKNRISMPSFGQSCG